MLAKSTVRHAAFVGAGVVALLALRWFPVRVAGTSMSPTLGPGDLLAMRPCRAGEPRARQIVLARVDGREVIKRVARAREDEYWLEGDNPSASTDSRTLGWISRETIAGVARARYWPPARAKLLRP